MIILFLIYRCKHKSILVLTFPFYIVWENVYIHVYNKLFTSLFIKEMFGSDANVVVGVDGVLEEQEMKTLLKVTFVVVVVFQQEFRNCKNYLIKVNSFCWTTFSYSVAQPFT